MNDGELAAHATAVLERNRRDGWTSPSLALYPHQWLWDSCFTAIGLTHVDPQRAAEEVRSLLRGQWANGMVPHMVFAPGTHDPASRTIWRSHRHADAPRGVATSCITQPPVLAPAVRRVAAALDADTRRAFVAEVLPRVVAHHEWLYRTREEDESGLVTLLHPWECGLDTTPPWMAAMARTPIPRWLSFALRLRLARPLRALRADTRQLPAIERTSDDDGVRMIVQAVRIGRADFDLARMPRDGSVALLVDLAFNAILAAANRDLTALAADHAHPLSDDLLEAMVRTTNGLEPLWDAGDGEYRTRDALDGSLLPQSTVATLLPLWSTPLSTERVDRLVAMLDDPDRFAAPHPVPSVPLDAPEFQELRYWKGPTWVNMCWIVVQGLRLQRRDAEADALARRTLDLVAASGCSEYFSPLTGQGAGAPDFSWTAALTLDLAHDAGTGAAGSRS